MRKSGKESGEAFQSLIDYLQATNPVAAETARKIKAEMAQAAKDSQFKETLDSLRNLSPEGRAIAEGIKADMQQSAAASAGSLDTLVDKLAELDPAARLAAERIKTELTEAAKVASFDALLSQMRELGPEAAKVASEIKAEMKGATTETIGGFQHIIDQLRELDPAAADAAEKIQSRLAEASKQSEFKETLDSLRSLSPEGRAVAAAIETNMRQASAKASGSMEAMVDKLAELDPTAREVAAKVSAELAAADARTTFERSIAELSKINPTAAAAARAVNDKLTEADAQVKFDDIVNELRRVNPEAAKVAEKLRSEMRTASDDAGDSIFDSVKDATDQALPEIGRLTQGVGGIGERLVEIAGAGGAVGAFLAGIKLIGDAISENHNKLIETRDLALNVAAAQQDTTQNLVGMSIVDQNEVLSQRLPELAAELGVEDLAGLKAAYGAAYSASGGDAAAAERSVIAAASISSANTGGIRANAGAALDLARATGIAEPERNLALLGTARAAARVDDAEGFAKTLSKAVSQLVAQIPEQDKEALAKQSSAAFATLTQFATDTTGEETKTALIAFGSKLDELFDNLPSIAEEARDKLQKLEAANTLTPVQQVEKQELEAKQAGFTPAMQQELLALRGSATTREERLEKLKDTPTRDRTAQDEAEIKRLESENKKLARLEKSEFTDRDAAQLTTLTDRTVFTEMEKQQRESLKALVEAASTTVDPQDFAKRIQAVQASPALAEKLNEGGIGGEMFAGIFRQFSDADSELSKSFNETIGKISTDRKDFDSQAVAAMSATPAMLTGFLKRSGAAASNVAKLGQPGDAIGIQYEENVSKLLADTRGEGFFNSTLDYIDEVARPERLPGNFALSKAQSSVLPLIDRRESLIGMNKSAGGDPELEAKIAAIDSLIATHEKGLEAHVQSLVDGRIKARPGEIEEAIEYNTTRLNLAARPDAPNALGTDLGREILERQREQLSRLQAPTRESMQAPNVDRPLAPTDGARGTEIETVQAPARDLALSIEPAPIEDTALPRTPLTPPRTPARPGIINADQAAADLDAANQAAGVGTKSQQAIVNDQAAKLLERNIELAERQVQLMEQLAANSGETAQNTRPRALRQVSRTQIVAAARQMVMAS